MVGRLVRVLVVMGLCVLGLTPGAEAESLPATWS